MAFKLWGPALGVVLPLDMDNEVVFHGLRSLPGDFSLWLLKILIGLVPTFRAKVYFFGPFVEGGGKNI